jgi:putative ABC transport system permease protein
VVRAEIQALDPALPVPSFVTMDQQIGLSLLPQRVAAAALGSMGGVGLILAILGVYGVMAYLVSQRTREIGIRVAIGARHVDILKLVVGQGMRLALTGIALGVLVSAGVAKLIERFLYGAAMDALTFAAVPALLLTIALLASYVPARRALRVDPVRALRME